MKKRTKAIKRIYRKDPSRTSQLRRDMVQHLKLRFKILKQKIVDLITKEDALGLVQNSNPEGCNQYTGPDCSGTTKESIEHLEAQSQKAGKELYGDPEKMPKKVFHYGELIPTSSVRTGLSTEPTKKVIQKKLSDLLNRGLDEYEYIFHPSTGKGYDPKERGFSSATKEWVDKDGYIYTKLRDTVYRIKVDTSLTKPSITKESESVEPNKEYNSIVPNQTKKVGMFHYGQEITVKYPKPFEKLPSVKIKILSKQGDTYTSISEAGIIKKYTNKKLKELIINSNPDGCNQYTGKDCQGTSSKEQESEQPKEPSQQSLGKIKEKLQPVVEKLKKAGAKAKEIEHAVVSYTKDKVNKTVEKLPAPMQKVVNATVIAGRVATKTAFVTWVSGQALAEQIAKEKGKTEEEAKKLRSTLEALDIVAYKPVQIGLAVGLGPTAALTSFIPPATCIYLAYSTARNPVATAKAAKNLVKSLIQRFKKPKQQPPTTNSSKAQIEALEATLSEQGYSDWYIALLIEAYQQTEDLQEAITLAKEALTISPKNTTEEELVANIRWAAQTNPQKLIAFKQWVAQQIGLILTSQNEKELWKRFAEEGLKKGIGRAFNDTKKIRKYKKRNQEKLSFIEQDRGEFLNSSFNQPVATQRVQMLASRSFDDLENVTDDMETKLHRTLMDGLVQGTSPREIATGLVEQVGLSEERALTIARTEIIRAHADGQLLALKELGIESVGVAVEWSTTGDEKVCKACEPLEGIVMKLEEAEGLLPRHPNCRCAWIPANVGEEDTEDQVTTKTEIEQRLEESEAEFEDRWAPTIDRKRPVSIFNSVYIPEVVCLDEENN